MSKRCVVVVLLATVLPWTSLARGADYVQGRETAIKLYWADKREEALAMFEALAESSVTDLQKADALDWASTAALRLNRSSDALQYADQIPLAPMRKTALARVHATERRWQEVLEILRDEDLAQWPPSVAAEAFGIRGGTYLRLENPEAAIDDLVQAADLTTEHNARAGALLSLGQAHQALGDPEAAVHAYQQVHAATNNVARHADAAIAAAKILQAADDPAGAVAELDRVDVEKLRFPSLRIEVLMARGEAFARLGQHAAAVASYRQAIEHPGLSDAQRSTCQAAIEALGEAGR